MVGALAESAAREPLNNEASQLRFLHSWWSRTYNRPLKDPLLQTYTLEELYYEYRDKIERELAAQERAEDEADKIEEAKQADVDAWIEAEEAKEAKEGWKPSQKDQAWMEKELAEAKAQFGESFGEDIDEDFSGG
jgi:hypothetical protein